MCALRVAVQDAAAFEAFATKVNKETDKVAKDRSM